MEINTGAYHLLDSSDLVHESLVDHSSAPAARDPPIQQAKPDTKREPKDGCQDANDAELGLGDMFPGLETDHLRVIGRKQGSDHMASARVLVVIDGGGLASDGGGIGLRWCHTRRRRRPGGPFLVRRIRLLTDDVGLVVKLIASLAHLRGHPTGTGESCNVVTVRLWTGAPPQPCWKALTRASRHVVGRGKRHVVLVGHVGGVRF